jgi:low affinity Fe/Cu permease
MPLRQAVHQRPTSPGAPFDRFAEASADFASRGAFFAACLLIVMVWAPSYFLLRDVNTWELVINTVTTIVTFLLVALLQNSARRSEQAVHHKLDALADGLADLMEHQLSGDTAHLQRDIQELKQAIGLEHELSPIPVLPVRERMRGG